MNQKGLLGALIRGPARAPDSEAADNEPKRDAEIKAQLTPGEDVNFGRHMIFKPGRGRPRKGWLFARAQEPQRLFRHSGIAQ